MSKPFDWLRSHSEAAARMRLREIGEMEPKLEAKWEEYKRLWALHIKPLAPDVDRYFAEQNEKRKAEHWLQGLDAERKKHPKPLTGKRHWSLPPQIEKLPYAGKDDVGHRPRKTKDPDEVAAAEAMKKLKALPPEQFAALLKQIQQQGGK